MKSPFLRSYGFAVAFLSAILLISVLYWSGCSEKQDTANVVTTAQPALTKLSINDPSVRSVMAVQDRHTAELMKNTNIVGTYTGLTTDGRVAIFLMTKEPVSAKYPAVSSLPGNI